VVFTSKLARLLNRYVQKLNKETKQVLLLVDQRLHQEQDDEEDEHDEEDERDEPRRAPRGLFQQQQRSKSYSKPSTPSSALNLRAARKKWPPPSI
jgi:hypothetical protein